MDLSTTEPLAIGFFIAVAAAILTVIWIVKSDGDLESALYVPFAIFCLTWFVAMIFL